MKILLLFLTEPQGGGMCQDYRKRVFYQETLNSHLIAPNTLLLVVLYPLLLNDCIGEPLLQHVPHVDRLDEGVRPIDEGLSLQEPQMFCGCCVVIWALGNEAIAIWDGGVA